MSQSRMLQRLIRQGLIPRFSEGVTILLSDAPKATDKALKWIHVATEGVYKGHQQGAFTLTRQDFEQMVTNLRADPRYQVDEATGLGGTKVVPYDYEHASELNPTTGTIPLSGAPAPAWCMDLEVRDGPSGKAQLWAWSKLGKTIQLQLANEEYAYTSIAFPPKAKDPNTGADVGYRISSIAFTNTPFIRELEAIAATAKRLGDSLNFWAYPAKDFDDMLAQLRELYGLALGTDPAATIGEAEKSLDMAKQGTAPTGVPIDEVTAALRTIMGLAVTSTLDEIGVALGKARDQLVGSASDQPVEAPGSSTTPSEEPTRASEEPVMGLSDFGKKISRHFQGVKFLLSTTLLQDDADVDKAVEETVTKASDLEGMLQALGVKDAAAALSSIADLQGAKSKLDAATAELAEKMAMVGQVEEAQAQNDVGAALSAKGWDDSSKPALTVHREKLIEGQVKKLGDKPDGKKLLAAKEAGRKEFLTHYGVPDDSQSYLLKMLTVDSAGNDKTIEPEIAVPPKGKEVSTIKLRAQADGKKIIEVTAEDAGRNGTERLLSALSRLDPTFSKKSRIDQFNHVHTLRRSEDVVITGLGEV